MFEEEKKQELSVLDKERQELQEMKNKLKDYEELQRIRKEKEEVKEKIKEIGKKPSVFTNWGRRFAKNMDDDPFGIDKFK